MAKALWITLLLGSISIFSTAQAPDSLLIRRASAPIRIDGLLDEPDWNLADKATGFYQTFPMDTSLAIAQTVIRMTYDDQYIYVGAVMENLPDERGYVTPSLRRDFRGEANDAIVIVLDPFQDKTNAFQFGVNPYGVQREGLVVNGGNERFDLDLSWDNRWFVAAKPYKGYWIGEFAIPFSSLRYREGSDTWNIKFYRVDSEYTERSSWPRTPRQFPIMNLAFANKLIWDKPIGKAGGNMVLIPYGLANYSEDFDHEPTSIKRGANIGGDAKVGLGPALNLDLTVNPDFSQVEVDQQVTNLDRFEIFFPERRQFFLENADLFSNFGAERLRPFFSRRIGVARDESTGQNIQNPIYLGARVTGKIGDDWRVGLLSMQTARDLAINNPSTNFTVAAVQRKVFSRSNFGVIAINKQAIRDNGILDTLDESIYDYNRTLGFDYNLASANNKWTGKAFYHHSFDPDNPKNSFATGGQLAYGTLNWNGFITAQWVGANFNPEVGFVRRRDYQRIASTIQYSFYPKSGWINSHGPGVDVDVLGNENYGVTDWDANLLYRIQFQNTSELNVRLRREFVYLFSAFDPTNTDGVELPEGSAYAYNLTMIRYMSDARKPFFFSVNTRNGHYFNGTRNAFEGSMSYRFQPYGVLSVDFSYNRLRFPEPYTSTDLLLIGPRFDITFSKSIFWTTFVQYNNQIENININSRFQWRFAPVSDLFVVYTNNFFSDTFVTKNRGLVLKFTYWINV